MSNYYLSKCCSEQVNIISDNKGFYVCQRCKEPCEVTAMMDTPGCVPEINMMSKISDAYEKGIQDAVDIISAYNLHYGDKVALIKEIKK